MAVVFSADDGVHGQELWITNGTAEGTRLLKDIDPGSPSSNWSIGTLTPLSDKIAFITGAFEGSRLWITDGSEVGTTLLAALNGTITDVAAFGNKLFLDVASSTGVDLWVSDGTAAGTQLIRPGSASQFDGYHTYSLTALGDKFIFTAADPLTGREVWVTDGTAAGTALLKDIVDDSLYPTSSYGALGSIPQGYTVIGDRAVFDADNNFGRTLFVTDGTSSGTMEVSLQDYPYHFQFAYDFAKLGSDALFTGTVQGTTGGQLWRTDGTAMGTELVKAFVADDPMSVWIHAFSVAPSESSLLFAVDSITSTWTQGADTGLWITDGTTAGTQQLYEGSFDLQAVTHLGDVVVFEAGDGNGKAKLWVTDGSAQGTRMLSDVDLYAADAWNVPMFTRVGDKLVFAAAAVSTNDFDLWITDGTEAGTHLLKDINPAGASDPVLSISLGGTALFTAFDGTKFGLWRTDGTEAGTNLVYNFTSDGAGVPREYTYVNLAPTDIALSTASIAENTAAGSLVGMLQTTDFDLTDTYTYSLLDDAGGQFVLDGNRIISAPGTTFDFEAQSSYDITVRSTDQGGKFVDKTLTISVADVNEAPTGVVLANTMINERYANGAVVGALTTIDPDHGDAHTYSLLDSAGGRFALNGGDLVVADSARLLVRDPGVYPIGMVYQTITVRAIDAAGLFVDRQIKIYVDDLPDAPDRIDYTSASGVAEGFAYPSNVYLGTPSAHDNDAFDSFTYSLVDNAGGRFFLSYGDNGLYAAKGAVFDFETERTVSVTVRATDRTGLFVDKMLTIPVANVNEAPSDIALSNAHVQEHSVEDTVVGTLSATDPDAGDTHTYALLDDAGGRFKIANGNTLVVADRTLLDYEQATSHTVTVRVTDAGGLTFDKVISIAVDDVDPDIAAGDAKNNTFVGGAGNDRLFGDSGDDTLTGGAGADTLNGGAGADSMAGGSGDDTYDVDNTNDTIVELQGEGIDTVNSSVTWTLGANVENLTLTGYDGLDGIGNDLDNLVVGNYEINSLYGGDGNDTLAGQDSGGSYGDHLYGGSGDDKLYVSGGGSIDGGAGIDRVIVDISSGLLGTALSNVEIMEIAYANMGLSIELSTFAAFSSIVSPDGQMSFFLTGDGGTANLSSVLKGTFAAKLYAQELTSGVHLTLGQGNEAVTGSNFDDTIFGGAGNDKLDGGKGADYLSGDAGADTLSGGGGDDLYIVDSIRDGVIETNADAAAGGLDRVFASVTHTLSANVENLRLTGSAAINGTGNALANALTGNSGDNVLDGRGGVDVLIGGAGKDTFVFSTPIGKLNADFIADFSSVDDTIRLENTGAKMFNALSTGVLGADAFYATSGAVRAHDASDRIVYNTATGALYYDADGLGGAEAVRFATLKVAPALTNADFVVV